MSDIYSTAFVMADVQFNGRATMARVPRIDRLMTNMESMCRRYDNRITSCIWLVVLLIVWCVIAPGIGSTTTYTGEFDRGEVQHIGAMARAESRLLRRVVRVLDERCHKSNDPFVLAPQVSVNQEPYMFNMMKLCAQDNVLLNARVVVEGTSSGTCLDGLSRRIARPYPVTVAFETLQGTQDSISLLTLEDVCPVLYAIDLLSGKW